MRLKIIMFVFIGLLAVSFVFNKPENAKSQQIQPEQITQLFDKVKDARANVGYRGTVKVERHYGDRQSGRRGGGRDSSGRGGGGRGGSRGLSERGGGRGSSEWGTFRKTVTFIPSLSINREEMIFDQLEQSMRDSLRGRWNRARSESSRRYNSFRGQMGSNFRRDLPQGMNFADIEVKPDLLARNYNLSYKSKETIIDRSVDYISINPKYPHRPGYKLWIDEETGVILKNEVFIPSESDTLRFIEEFESIQFADPEMIEQFRQRMSQEKPQEITDEGHRKPEGIQRTRFSSINELPGRIRSQVVVPKVLPEGFVLDEVRINSEGRRRILFHQIYTDGLIAFSLFQNRGDLPKEFQKPEMSGRHGSQRSRPMPSRDIIMVKKDDRNNYIVIGILNRDLLQMVFDSLPGKKP
ncbi:sigma-E factor regulatory protein RseB domain-containing protein [candidate division KSB1 bacterium]